MINKLYIITILFVKPIFTTAQSDTAIVNALNKYNKHSIPYIYVKNISNANEFYFLDAREEAEFTVSKIPNAYFVGYNNFSIEKVKKIVTSNNTPIIVYCTIGVRSEKIAEQLKSAGFISVHNLWGGILDWKNNHLAITNSNNQNTNKVHTYSKNWSRYLKNGQAIY